MTIDDELAALVRQIIRAEKAGRPADHLRQRAAVLVATALSGQADAR